MSWKRITQYSLLAVGLYTLAGCRLGATTDRDIQVGRHANGDRPFEIAPETRLSRMQAGDHAQASHLTLSDDTSGVAHASHVSDASDDTQVTNASHAANRHPGEVYASLSDHHTLDLSSTEAQLMQAAGLAEADMQDLLAAFRDSPSEVRQQAVRQLIAAASVRANRTQAPVDINQRLGALLNDLPVLPDEIEESNQVPVRLGQAAPQATGQAEPAASSLALPVSDNPPTTPAVATVSSISDQASATMTMPALGLPPMDLSTGAAPIPAIDPAQAAAVAATPAPIATASEATASIAAAPIATAPEAPLSEQQLYSQLLGTLSVAAAGESDGDRLRRELAKRYLLVLTGDPDSAVQSLEGLTKAEQEFLRHHLLALWNLTNPEAHPVASRRLGAALPNYQTAVSHLRQATEQLEVRSLALCTEIVSYGQIKRFPPGPMTAGQKVILYCEIDNFVAEKTASGYVTELHGSYEIFNSDGVKVSGQVLPTDHQTCDHYLRDYFIAYQMSLPAGLPAGKYRLELTMECGKGKKYGQASLPLEIR